MNTLNKIIVAWTLLSGLSVHAQPIEPTWITRASLVWENSTSIERMAENQKYLNTILTGLQKSWANHPLPDTMRREMKFLKIYIHDMLYYSEWWEIDDIFTLQRAYNAYFWYKATLSRLSDLWLNTDSTKIMEPFEQKKEQFIKKLITDMADMAALNIHGKAPMLNKYAPLPIWAWEKTISELIEDLNKLGWELSATEASRITRLRTALNQIEACSRISGLTWTITFGDPTIPKIQALQDRIQQVCFWEILGPIRANTKLPNRKMIDYSE